MNWKIAVIISIIIVLFGVYAFWKSEQERHHDTIVLYGNVDVRQVDLSFRVPGRIDVLFFEEGDLIEPGALVAQLDKQPYADQLKEAAARLESIKASLTYAETVLKRRQELISEGSVSKEDLDNALSNHAIQQASFKQAKASLAIAKSNLSYTDIFAPTEGTILTRVREPGAVVNAADAVYTLSITSPVWIRAYSSEPDLGFIYPGMQAEVFTDTPGGPSYQGRVGFISPQAEFTPKTVETTQLRTDLVYRLRIYVDNPDRGLRQGMPVTIVLHINQERVENDGFIGRQK